MAKVVRSGLSVAKELSPLQQRILIAHVDGPVPITMTDSNVNIARGWLKNRWLIYGCTKSEAYSNPRNPTHTKLTRAGRETLAALLADQIETMIAAGYLEREVARRASPIIVLRELKTEIASRPAAPPIPSAAAILPKKAPAGSR
jgi:hypothetical protein